MNTEECNVDPRNKVKIYEIKKKEELKRKNIAKEQERRGRTPSYYLKKIAKKFLARNAKIMDCELQLEENEPMNIEDPIIGVKQLRLKLARPKRKPGHRQRPEASVFIEDSCIYGTRNQMANCVFR